MAVKKKLSELPVLRHYDKLLVVVALVALLVSLAYLVTAGMARDEEKGDSSRFAQDIQRLKASPTLVEPISMAPYDQAAKQLDEPFMVGLINREQHNFLTPECRVRCVNAACLKPIPEKAEVCPFCGEKQQEQRKINEEFSTLNDGVPDVFKRLHGINIREAGAADADIDGDGFTLLEEYLAKTDPTDPNSRPPYTAKLELRELRGKKLMMRFTGVNKMPDGNQLVFNWTDPRNRRTFWIRENQPIGETGYTAGQLTVKEEERERPGGGGNIRVDVSTVVVKRNSDGKEIVLQINEGEQNTDVEAVFVFLVDNSELTLLEAQEFKLRDETYRVVSINDKDGTVVVEDTGDGNKQKTFTK